MTLISKDLRKAISLLKDEKLVAIPTETVYGLAGNIYSKKAVNDIFLAKKRPFCNPLIVHINSISYLEKVAVDIPKKAKLLAETFWPGSLTLVLKKAKSIPSIITAGKETVAVRVPNHPVTLELLNKLAFPLAAPSANPFGRISPTKPKHIKGYFNNIEMILDGGPCLNGIESTIVGFENNKPTIYRLGALSVEKIESVVGKTILKNTKKEATKAPGMLEKHYAPVTKTFVTDSINLEIEKHINKKIGVLVFKNSLNNNSFTEIVLSKKGSISEAASKLYDSLHKLDGLNLDVILVEKFPNTGIGKSINDRLYRASF